MTPGEAGSSPTPRPGGAGPGRATAGNLDTSRVAPCPPSSTSIAPHVDAISEIVALHSEVVTAARTTLDKAIRIGELLTEQKASLKHGQWLPWMEANLPFSQQTASNYVRVFANRSKLPTVGNLELTDAYRLLADGKEKTAHVAHNSGDEIPTPEGLVGAEQSVWDAVYSLFLSERDQANKELATVEAAHPPETADGEGTSESLRACLAIRQTAVKWAQYWNVVELYHDRRLGAAIINLRELLSSAPWPELTKLYPRLLRQREKHPEAAMLWDIYPDEMMVLETARAFHVTDTTGRAT